MTVEELKKLAKDECGRDLTDEQAREVLNAAASAAAGGELPDETLDAVSGGFNWKAAVDLMARVGIDELYKKL